MSKLSITHQRMQLPKQQVTCHRHEKPTLQATAQFVFNESHFLILFSLLYFSPTFNCK